VPFWREVAEAAGFEPRFLLAVRHPTEVVASLAVRDGLGAERAYQLWQRYLLEAEFSTRDAVRTVVCFETLMSDWRSVARASSRELQIEWPHPPEEVGSAVSDFLRSGLRSHHHVDAEAPAGVNRGLYELFQRAESNVGELAPKRMDEARMALDADVAVHRRLIDEYQQSLLRCRSMVARRLDEIERLRLGASSLEEWAKEVAHSLERAKADHLRALDWVVESLFDGLAEARPEAGVALETQLNSALVATHRRREEDSLYLAQGRDELETVRAELVEARAHLDRSVAEGRARAEALKSALDRSRRSAEELVAREDAFGELRGRYERLSGHAERLEAKIDLVRRVPLAGWLWRLLSRG
jgi:hypothetical protein